MQPTHGRQCEFGTAANGVWPYTRCTGSSGHRLEHQPLLPLNSVPPTSAANSDPPSSAPVATPESLNSGSRDATAAMKSPIPSGWATTKKLRGSVNARVNFR